MKKTFLILFVIASMGELSSHVTNVPYLQWFCKPLIMLALIGYYYTSVTQVNRSVACMLAMSFSFGGDTLLMFEKQDPMFFILGLASFLLSHIFYIVTYRQHQVNGSPTQLQGVQRTRLAFPVVLMGTGLIIVLYPTLDALRLPVMMYAIVLVVMVLQALFRYGRTNMASFWCVFAGALLFMISDSVLAINKFLSPVPYAGLLIISSYCVAQLLIVYGILEHHGHLN